MNTTTHTLPVSSIICEDRQRDLNQSHVDSLALSIKDLGLIQPIVINQHNRLIAGAHRLAAHKKLGLSEIKVVYRETMTDDEFAELELVENTKRLDNTWQETCIGIAKIHFLKCRRAALDSKTWGQRETGDLLKVNQAKVAYSLVVAKELLNDTAKSGPFWKAENFTEAYALILKRAENVALATLAQQQVVTTTTSTGSPFDTSDEDDTETFVALSADQVDHLVDWKPVFHAPKAEKEPCPTCQGLSANWVNGNCVTCNRTGYAPLSVPKIPLSTRYLKGDSITVMNMACNTERFDHIITDIPFGIDIDMIDQSNSMRNIDDIKAEHTVDGNLELHAQFFKAAYNCIKPQGYCITWCDIMQWQRMYDLAVDAGFKVTRWPFVWVKTYPCLNQMAQYNFTKSTEFAIICRKGAITLPTKQSNNFILAERDELSRNHPFAKPFALWERLITAVSIENQSILDPFCGSGSAFISGVRLGRIMYGIEKDEALYNSGLETLKQFYLTLTPNAQFV